MATERPGEGTQLQIKISSTYTSVGLVEEIDGFEVTIAAVPTTHLGSTLKTTRPSRLADPGKISAKVQLDPNDTTHQLLYTHASDPGTIDDWKMIFVDDMATPANATFFGYLTKFKITGEKVEENVMAEIEIQLTSIPVMTAGAAA